jgi:hypothetical protein
MIFYSLRDNENVPFMHYQSDLHRSPRKRNTLLIKHERRICPQILLTNHSLRFRLHFLSFKQPHILEIDMRLA